MLPNKNELNDKSIEQINGGLEDDGLIPPGSIDSSSDDLSKITGIPDHYLCPNCGKNYFAYEERTDGYCPNCEARPLKMEFSTGNMKTTVPIPSDKNKLIKVH